MSPAPTTLRSVHALADAGLVQAHDRAALADVAKLYAVAITPDMAALIDRGDGADPISRQFVPDARELVTKPSERADPIGDFAHSPVPGIVHRYADRVLLKIAHVCPIYCRFCFRRELVGPDNGAPMTDDDLYAALDYIAATPAIWEVIMTGGDPFVLSPRRVRDVTERLGSVPHVKILRWHTRVPVVDPARVTDALIDALTSSVKTVYVGIHTNHARELTRAARGAIVRLADAGIPLVSQTVLLRGVNDSVAALADLMRALVELRVQPYYLHHGDLAPGTSHFRLTLDEGMELVRALRRQLSGLAMPAYVLDIPGGFGKVPLGEAVTALGDGTYRVTDPSGREHIYFD